MRKNQRKRRSRVIVVALLLALFFSSVLSGAWYGLQPTGRPADTRIKIGFIGDSITHGPNTGTSVVTDEMKNLGTSKYVAVNRGVSGSTTSDWQPGKPMFDTALAAFKADNVHMVSIMLGTNDARTDIAITPSTYGKNMSTIISSLFASGVSQVIINYPPFVVPGSYKGLWTDSSVSRMMLYRDQLDILASQRGVVRGDTDAFDYFKSHTDLLVDGVHPTQNGNVTLARLWASAFKKAQPETVAREALTNLGLLPSDS